MLISLQEEAVPESLKNILLVMANGGLLVPPSENPEHAELWNETWKKLEKFLPGMFAELFPQTQEKEEPKKEKEKEKEKEQGPPKEKEREAAVAATSTGDVPTETKA